jgi:hypothetical protein
MTDTGYHNSIMSTNDVYWDAMMMKLSERTVMYQEHVRGRDKVTNV